MLVTKGEVSNKQHGLYLSIAAWFFSSLRKMLGGSLVEILLKLYYGFVDVRQIGGSLAALS